MLTSIYILKLTNNKFYVGSTKNIQKRINEHINGFGSEWTKTYKVINVIQIFNNVSPFEEDAKVLELMDINGINNVRGGSYSQITLNQQTKTEIIKKLNSANNLCVKCGSNNHFIKDCPLNHKSVQNKINKLYCIRCGRNSHTIKNCYSKYDINKNLILDHHHPHCIRCGHNNHLINNCFAKIDINGNLIID
jgi:GIY-YIG catalytic domain-containing protein